MKYHCGKKRSLSKKLVLGLVMASLCGGAQATQSLTDAATLLEAMGDPNSNETMKKLGLKIGGWINAGVTHNFNDPTSGFNGPVTFGDRNNEFQLDQINIFVQRAVATEGKAFDLGFRFDAMYGTDSIFTQAYGAPTYNVNTGTPQDRGSWDLQLLNMGRFYGLAIPQAYLESYLPFGNGVNLKIGHFYTPIGFETVPAPDNFFYTHAYTMQYGEPFTHTGVMANYSIDSNWAVMGGVTTGSATGGWDGSFNAQLGNWSGLMGATWTSTDKGTSLNVSGTYGNISETTNKKWAIYSIVGKHNITEKTHLMLQHDHGYAEGVLVAAGTKDAEWYGVNSHLYYDVHEKVVIGLRGEWFRDQDGFRVCSPGRVGAAANVDAGGNAYNFAGTAAANCIPATYYSVTAGLNWKPVKWLNVRPNVRYDYASYNGPVSPFGDGKNNQVIISADFNISF